MGLSVDLPSQDVGLSKLMLWLGNASFGLGHLALAFCRAMIWSRLILKTTTMGVPRAAFSDVVVCI
jgi:hypothetical protein